MVEKPTFPLKRLTAPRLFLGGTGSLSNVTLSSFDLILVKRTKYRQNPENAVADFREECRNSQDSWACKDVPWKFALSRSALKQYFLPLPTRFCSTDKSGNTLILAGLSLFWSSPINTAFYLIHRWMQNCKSPCPFLVNTKIEKWHYVILYKAIFLSRSQGRDKLTWLLPQNERNHSSRAFRLTGRSSEGSHNRSEIWSNRVKQSEGYT